MDIPFRRARKALGIASISLFGAEGGAWAQQTPTPTPPTLPEVRVRDADDGFKTDATKAVTRTDTPLRDIPQFVNILSQELLRSQNATTLVDALRNVPGISYAAAEGGTQANQVIYLRGFPLNADIFVNGVRDLGEYNRDLFATDSVEVLKGSSALLFGRGSPGGLINQTFKSAYRVNASQVDATFGSFDQKRVVGDANFRVGSNAAVRLIAMAENSGSYRYRQDVEKYGFAPSFLWDLGPTTQLTGSWYWFKGRDVTDYGQPTLFSAAQGFWGFPDVSPRKYYGYEKHDFAHYETNIVDLRVDHQFSGTLSLDSTLRYARYERQSESTIPSLAALDANGNPVTRETPHELLRVNRNHDTGRTKDNDDDALISQTEIVWKPVTGTVRHVVLGGLELARERIDRVNYALDANPDVTGVQTPTSQTPFLDPDPSTSLNYTKTPNIRGTAEANSISLYAQDQMTLTPQWKALVGVRWERYASEARNDALSSTATSTGPFERTDRMLSGRAGLIWQPTETQSYYVVWGNAYNPSGELGVYGGTASTNLNPANEAVGPEKSQNAEVGAQWNFGALQLRSALFRNEKTNQRIIDDTGATVLAGKRRIDGIEFELSGLITPNWEIYGGLAFMDGKITNGTPITTGKTPLGVAEVQGSVWTVYKLGGGWEVGGGLRGQKGTWLTDANVPGSQIPSHVLVDAMLAYIQPKWEVRVNGYNLGDKTYYIGGYNNSPSRVIPGQPVYGNVTLTYRF
ncbi:MAG TPA: TonB-dependent siderophore receptor [Casimicrobiaceae bacterium]